MRPVPQPNSKTDAIPFFRCLKKEMKFSYILNLGVDRHFENDDYEVSLINQVCNEKGHNCLVVPVEDPYWRDLVY